MRQILCVVLLCVLLLSGCCLQHSWKDADCERPRTCEKCGKTEGEALGHTWEDATCEKPRTCSRCGATEGEPLEHTLGEWEETSRDVVEAQISYVQKCVQCGQVVNTRQEMLEHIFEDHEFLLTVADFQSRFLNMLEENWSRRDRGVSLDVLPDRLQYKIISDIRTLGMIDFLNLGEMSIREEGKDIEKIAYVLSSFLCRDARDQETVFWAMNGLIRTFNPTMTVEEAEKFMYSLIEESAENPRAIKENNGVYYVFAQQDQTFLMMIYCA